MTVPAQTPELLAAGKFALYRTENDGLHISLKMEGSDEEKHISVPPLMVKMMMRNPMFGNVKDQYHD